MKQIILFIFFLLAFTLFKCSSNHREDRLGIDSRHLVKHNPTDRNYITYFHENYYDQLKVNNIMLFFTKENKQEVPKALGMILNHTRKDPLDIQQYQFVIDGDIFDYFPQNIYTIDDFEKEQTIVSCQDTLTDNSFLIIKDIINSNQAKLIYLGANGSVTFEIDHHMKAQMSQVIEAYKNMGGMIP
ncbi:MAG: hypothetical protein ACNS62_23210 [Candidatus Cyclobacteriaceae bacterium M3_2C_046]